MSLRAFFADIHLLSLTFAERGLINRNMSYGKLQKYVFTAAGIFVCYLCFGLMQEDITRTHYKLPDGSYEIFVCPTTIVCFCCSVNFLFAKLLSVTIFKVGEDSTKKIYYLLVALTYLLAMVCGNMSLQFVNYPTHVVGKTIKPIFVMALGVLLGRKHYGIKKCFFVVLIVSGATLFLYKDKGDPSMNKGFSLGFGELLLFLSLVMDGFTASIQDHMLGEHQTESISMMLNVNKWATLYATVTVLLTGEFSTFLEFMSRHPLVIGKLILLSLASSAGQYFIFLHITEFGPLSCSVIATLRKLFSVLISSLFLGNRLIFRQWIGTVLVFGGLFLDLYFGRSPAKPK